MTESDLRDFEIANASVVTDRLWIGGDLSTYDEELAGRELDELVGRGLTNILDVREEWSDQEQVARAHPELAYCWRGIPDLGQEVLGDWFDDVTGFALEAFAEPGTVVLAHCHAGINRGPSAGFAILIASGRDPIEALELIHRQRPIVMIAYAEDALRWAHTRLAMAHDLDTDLARLRAWRRESRTELVDVMRQTRSPEL